MAAMLLSGCRPNPTVGWVSGTIENDHVRIGARVGGRVQGVFAAEGAELKPGDRVALLVAPELTARRAQAEALLNELKVGARREEIAAAGAEHQALLAELDLARIEARRATELFNQRTLPENDRDVAVSRVARLEQSAAAAKSRLELLLAGTRVERIQHAEAQLAELDAQLAELEVVSPTNAVLEALHVKPGDILAPNREVATLLIVDSLWVRVYVPEPWLGRLRLGLPLKVRVDSFPGAEFPGTVEQIARAAEFTPRNVQTVAERVKQVFGVKVRLPNPDGRLRAGMAADVLIPNEPAVP
jgi:HlyD family secretion protein